MSLFHSARNRKNSIKQHKMKHLFDRFGFGTWYIIFRFRSSYLCHSNADYERFLVNWYTCTAYWNSQFNYEWSEAQNLFHSYYNNSTFSHPNPKNWLMEQHIRNYWNVYLSFLCVCWKSDSEHMLHG